MSQILKYSFYYASYLAGNYAHANYDITKYTSILTTMFITFDIGIFMDMLDLPKDTSRFDGLVWDILGYCCIFGGLLMIAMSAKVCKNKLYLHAFYPFRGGIYEYLTDPFYYGKAVFFLGVSIHNSTMAGVLISSFLYALSNLGIAVVEKKYIQSWIRELANKQK